MKANSRKTSNSSLKAKYTRQKDRIVKRKDRHVRKSSHGKFGSVAELVAYQQRVEQGAPKRKRSAA